MALITRYVNTASTSGGDGTTNATTGPNRAYVSLSAAEAAEATDLVSAGDQIEFLCTGTAADTTVAVISTGWTTGASNDITVKPNSSDVNTTGIYDTGKYRLELGANYSGNIRVQSPANHFTVDGIQSQANGFQAALYLQGTGHMRALGCICRSTSASANSRGIRHGGTSGDFLLVNNVIYDFTNIGIHNDSFQSSGTRTYYNNTVDSCSTGLSIASGSATTRVFNNLLTNNTTDYSSSASPTTDNNITSDATSPDTAHRNITVTYTDAAGGDFSTSDTDVVDQGTDLSSDSTYAFSDDIIGTSRPQGSAWDIGAFEDIASGAFTLAADSGSYSVTGTAADLLLGAEVSADSGSYTYSGTDADLNRGYALAADSGAYAYSGTDATLTFSPAGDFTLIADSGTYTYTGTNAGLEAAFVIPSDSGAYTYTGTDAGLNRGFSLVADSGTYSYTGSDADFSVTVTLEAEAGTYTYTGTGVILKASGQVWTIQADAVTTWTEQADSNTTWTIQ